MVLAIVFHGSRRISLTPVRFAFRTCPSASNFEGVIRITIMLLWFWLSPCYGAILQIIFASTAANSTYNWGNIGGSRSSRFHGSITELPAYDSPDIGVRWRVNVRNGFPIIFVPNFNSAVVSIRETNIHPSWWPRVSAMVRTAVVHAVVVVVVVCAVVIVVVVVRAVSTLFVFSRNRQTGRDAK